MAKPSAPKYAKAVSLIANLPISREEETFEDILKRPGVRLERIISYGQSTPPGEWYDQSWDEWVMVVSGEAELLIEGEVDPMTLSAGDSLLLPAHCRHRVESTLKDQPTVWLALHLGEDDK